VFFEGDEGEVGSGKREREESRDLRGYFQGCALQRFFKFQAMGRKIRVLEGVSTGYVIS
jgi:hypothetical protein